MNSNGNNSIIEMEADELTRLTAQVKETVANVDCKKNRKTI